MKKCAVVTIAVLFVGLFIATITPSQAQQQAGENLRGWKGSPQQTWENIRNWSGPKTPRNIRIKEKAFPIPI